MFRLKFCLALLIKRNLIKRGPIVETKSDTFRYKNLLKKRVYNDSFEVQTTKEETGKLLNGFLKHMEAYRKNLGRF